MRLTAGVIIPTYNHPEELAVTLESIIAQDWPVEAIVIVDDMSNNENRDKNRHYAKLANAWYIHLDYSIKYFRRNQAINAGLTVLPTDVVIVLNENTIMPNHYVDFMMELHQKYENLVIFPNIYRYVNIDEWDYRNTIATKQWSKLLEKAYWLHKDYEGRINWSTIENVVLGNEDGCLALPSYARNNNLYFDPRIVGYGAEDVLLYYNFIDHGYFPACFNDLFLVAVGKKDPSDDYYMVGHAHTLVMTRKVTFNRQSQEVVLKCRQY